MSKRTPLLPLAPLVLALALATHGTGVQAQRLALPNGAGTGTTTQPGDHIVAVVNSEPITSADVRARLARVEAPRGGNLPPKDELARQVLDMLINERVLMQTATKLGIKVDDAAVRGAEQSVARQNNVDTAELHRRLAGMGIELSRFREDLRKDLLLQRVREREVDGKVRVTEQDIDDYVRDRQGASGVDGLEINLAQILVQIPEGASAAVVAEQQARAAALLARARGGEDFAALARATSDAGDRAQGGQLGLRPADRYPTLFVEATRNLKAGDITGPVRSGAGLHILKVVEKRVPGMPDTVIPQTRARHILLRPNAQLTEAAAIERLRGYKQALEAGQASFEALAREHSQDGSAQQGGDLGWANPGMFVPEFEAAMNALNPGQLSAPLVSRFGVHLIQVVERRQYELTPREQREVLRGLAREQVAERAYTEWVREQRAQAYVDLREPPQ
jgi:peptidyl-prolyl cis-trans isomerase SurA